MIENSVSLCGIKWKYIFQQDNDLLVNGEEYFLRGKVVKENSKRTVIHQKRGVFVKEVRYGWFSGILKSIIGGTACKEGQNYLELKKYGFNVPTVLGFGGERVFWGGLQRDVLLTEEVKGGKSLHEFIFEDYNKLSPSEKYSLIDDFAHFNSVLHEQGIVHGDFHYGNILVVKDGEGWKFIILDADRVKFLGRPYSKAEKFKGLVLLHMAFGGLVNRSQRLRFLCSYGLVSASERARVAHAIDSAALKASVRIWRGKSRRCMRTNSRFVREQRGGFRVHRVRSHETDLLLGELLPDPDGLMEKGEIIKDGRTVRAIAITVNDRRYFLKRYNCKGGVYRLKNALRRSRAVRTWLVTWGYRVREIPVPVPLLCLEERNFRLLGRSYVLSEFIDGTKQLREVWPDLDSLERKGLLARLAILLGRMHFLGLVHGDLKWGNILVRGEGGKNVCLADLDGSKVVGPGKRRFKRKDLERFLVDLVKNQSGNNEKAFFLKCWERWSS